MQPPSVCPRRGCIPWQGLLLAVSLLTWNPHPTVQLTIEPVRVDAAEGTEVLLLVHNVSGNLIGYYWYKGNITDRNLQIASYPLATQSSTPGPAHSGRETIYPNGSLLFVNVMQEDTGFYTVQTVRDDLSDEAATAELRVHEELSKPYITSNNSQPKEGEDSIALTCEPETKYTTYVWWINNQKIPDGDRQELSVDSRTLILFNVTRNDTGPYVCETRNPVSVNQSDPFTLNIAYGPDTPIINPPDTHFHPGIDLNLTCYADSNPPAQYSWFFNEIALDTTQTLSIPNISTNNSGSYKCIANNSVTGLNRTTTKNIIISESVTKPHLTASNTSVAEYDSVQLTCISNDSGISIRWIFKGEPLEITERMNLTSNDSILTINPVKREDDGDYQCEVFNPISSEPSNSLRLFVTFVSDPTPDSGGGLSGGAIAGIVVGAVAGVALVAVLVYFLFCRKTGGASDQHDLTEHKPSASNHSLGPSDQPPDKVDEVAYSSLNFNAQQPKQPTSATSLSPTHTETVYSEVKKK